MMSKTMYAKGGQLIYPSIIWTENNAVYELNNETNPVPDDISGHLDCLYNQNGDNEEDDDGEFALPEEKGGWMFTTEAIAADSIRRMIGLPYGYTKIISDFDESIACATIPDIVNCLDGLGLTEKE